MFRFLNRSDDAVIREIQRNITRRRSRNVIVDLRKDGRQCNLLLAANSFFGTDGENIDIYTAPLSSRERYRRMYGTDRFSAGEIHDVIFV